jgi:hypothetical protein
MVLSGESLSATMRGRRIFNLGPGNFVGRDFGERASDEASHFEHQSSGLQADNLGLEFSIFLDCQHADCR